MKDDLLKEFGELALATFKEALAPYGFKRQFKKTEHSCCEIVFANGERYVRILADTHPRDWPPHFNLVLGEGSWEKFPELDWNSVVLWRLKNLISSTDTGSEFSLEPPVKLPALLDRARSELLEFGASFLTGDVRIFRRARSEQNRTREPYKIYSPGENGMYTVAEDPESARMKERYS